MSSECSLFTLAYLHNNVEKRAIWSIIWDRQSQFSPAITPVGYNRFFLKTYLSELGIIFLTIKTAFEAITPDPKNDLLKSLIE